MHWIFVNRTACSGPAAHGMKALEEALANKGISYSVTNCHLGPLKDGLVFIGTDDEPAIYRQHTFIDKMPPDSFTFCRNSFSRIISASNALGLAYGLFELAERVEDEGASALINWPEMQCKPGHRVRGVDRFITNSQDECWWMSREYWDFYFKMLVSSRFNSFTLILGFDTAYFSPPYPFFVDVPGYESITVPVWIDKEKYLAALNQIGKMCHDYGLKFIFGTWQQQPWQEAQNMMVQGITDDNIEAYCAAGLKELLKACPHIDQIHFRVNHESGVGTQVSAEQYWLRQIDAIAEFNQEYGRDVALELRAKGMTDKMIAHGKKRGLKLTVSTKYYCEQAGLPFHITRMRTEEITRMDNFNHSRRYSYADMLRRPRLHNFVYRMWNNGSTNLFTWGSPDYVRRFIDSLRVGDSEGFEVMAQLSYKGGHQYIMADKPWKLFADPSMQPEGFEESRYWLFYRLFGRIGYDMNEDEETWMRPMRAHFGKSAHSVMDMIDTMSLIIPYIVAYHFPTHPQQEYWAELNTGSALFPEHTYNHTQKRAGVTYQSSLPSDEGLFYSIDQYVTDMLAGCADGRITPYQSAARLYDIVNKTRTMLDKAEEIGMPDTNEARGVVHDAKMLMKLGEYHIEKSHAAIGVSLFNQAEKFGYARSALDHMRKARALWAELAELGKAYHSDLNFCTGVAHVNMGTWSDSLVEMDADIRRLESLTDGEEAIEISRAANFSPPQWRAGVPIMHPAGKDLRIVLDVNTGAVSPVRLRWRRNNHHDGLFRAIEMSPCNEGLCAIIPANEVKPEWDILLYFESVDELGDALQYPGILHPEITLPYYIVKVKCEKSLRT